MLRDHQRNTRQQTLLASFLGCSVSSTTLFTFFGRHIVEIKQMFRLQQTPPESSVKSTMSGRETEDQQRQRFQVELEFVQSFANPNYLNCELLQFITLAHFNDSF